MSIKMTAVVLGVALLGGLISIPMLEASSSDAGAELVSIDQLPVHALGCDCELAAGVCPLDCIYMEDDKGMNDCPNCNGGTYDADNSDVCESTKMDN
jgi:hypothetical protein